MKLYEVKTEGDAPERAYFETRASATACAKARARVGQLVELAAVELPHLTKMIVCELMNGDRRRTHADQLATYEPHGQKNTAGKYDQVRVQSIEIEGGVS